MPRLYGADNSVVSMDEKDVIPVTRQEIIMLSLLHEFAVKHGITVVCKKCDHAFVGNNNDSQPSLSINCQCREFRHTRG